MEVTQLDLIKKELRNIRLFQHCTPAQLEEILSATTCSMFKKGQAIFNDGNFPQGTYYVNKGVMKLVRTNNEGKEQILRFAKTGDFIGYRALIAEEPFVASAICIEETIVCFIPRATFFKILNENHGMTKEVMKSLSHDLGVVEERVQSLAQKSVRERLAETLLFLQHTFSNAANSDLEDGVIHITLPREDIANIVGTATETIIRLLSEFKHDKYIELDGKKIKIINKQKLEKISTASV
jgi:CRP/FNR family transcriptional regulator, polysaccharide utilization system transcription regulator